MSKTRHTFRLTALAAALAASFGSVFAQDADLKAFTKPDSSVSVGVGYWSNDRPQQGIYDGMNKGGAYGLLDAYVAKRDDATGTWFTLYGRNLGLDTRELRVDWLRQGNIGAFLEYSQTPRNTPYTINTGLIGFGSMIQTVNNITPGAGSNFTISTERDRIGAGLFKNLAPGLDFRVNFSNEDKSGSRLWGRGGAPEFAVEPINSRIQIAEATLEYAGKRFQVNGGYIGNWYTNYNDKVQAIGSPATAANTYFLSLPLDNQANQIFANGGYDFTTGTRGTFKVSYTKATQNEQNPTGSLTGTQAPLAGAPTNLNGEIDTTLVQLGVTSRLTSAASLLANLRYYDTQEKTPQSRYIQNGALPCATGPTGTPGATCVDNTPLGFKTWAGKVEGTYRLPMGFSLIGGLDYASQDRVVPVGMGTVDANGVDRQRYVPFKSKLDETTIRLQARRSLTETINGSLAYLYSKRDGSQYTPTNESESNEISPIHIIDRKRDKWRAVLDWTPLEKLSITANLEYAKDKYSNDAGRPYGLQDGSAANYTLDATYALNDNWNLTAWYSYDYAKATQIGQRAATGTAGSAEKDANLEDTGKGFGLGLRGRFNPRFNVGADALYSGTTSKYPETVTLTGPGTLYPAGINGPLKDIENKLTRLKLFAVYGLDKNSDLRFDYIYENWRTNDWSWQFFNGTPFIYGAAPSDGTTISQPSKQKSDFIGVRYTYKFQ